MTGSIAYRHPHLTKWLLVVLYAAVAAVTLGANPFRNQTITPFDVLVSQRAWSFVDPSVHVRDYQRSDILNSRMPQWEVAKKRLRDGHIPLWNDKIAGGGPFLTVNTNVFTPAFAIFAAVPDPALGFYLAMLANLVIAGLGMHLLLRRHVGWLAAIVGAITFELCGFNAAWLYWPHVFTVIWAPWLLLSIERCARTPGVRNGLMIAVTSALVCLGGFPFLSVLVMEMGALYALVQWAFLWRGRSGHWPFAGWYVAGTVLGLVLAALPLLGLEYWLQQFDISYRYGRGSYLDYHYIKQLFPPWAYELQRVEQTMYVGAAMIALAIAALVGILARWRRMTPLTTFLVVLLPILVGLVFGLWPMWLIGWLPGMAFNSWSRAIGLLDINLVILGALAIDYLWRKGRKGNLRLIRAALIVVAVAQVVEIGMFFRDYNGPVSADYYFPKTPSIEYMREHSGPFDYAITDKSFVMSGTLGVYGLREWLAHYFRSPALQKVLHRMAKDPFNSHVASASRFAASGIKYESTAMAAYNVRFAAIDSRKHPSKGEDSHFKRVFEGAGTAVYENNASPDGPYFLANVKNTPGARSGRHVHVDSYRPEAFRLSYTGDAAGYVVVPMSINKGWQIFADGKPTSYTLKDGVMPAIEVAGPTKIQFTYFPRVLVWLYPWIAAVIGMVLAMLYVGRRTSHPRKGAVGTHAEG